MIIHKINQIQKKPLLTALSGGYKTKKAPFREPFIMQIISLFAS